MKKILTILPILLSILIFTSCSTEKQTSIPDVTNVLIQDGRSALSSVGLLPIIEYEYSDTFEKDRITRTNPDVYSEVNPNSKVTVYVSKGPSYIESKNSTITWYNIGSNADKWEFTKPYIIDGILYINCHTVTFGTDMEWSDQYNSGYGFGNASINDTFDKTVPVQIDYDKQTHIAGEAQNITFEIPLTDLNVDKPTDIYLNLFANINGEQQNIIIEFAMTW